MDYVQGIYISRFYYILRALLYKLKNGGFFSMLDEGLWVYMHLNIKVHETYPLISSLN
jgi:hypothetical protein